MRFFKLIEVHFLVIELYIYQNARCNNKNTIIYIDFLLGLRCRTIVEGFEDVMMYSVLCHPC